MKELLLFVCLMIGHSFGISEQKVVKSGRLFSNPFGILGHEACPTTLKGRNVTGICYNEMECLLRGGLFAGYCGPPAIEGICCVFSYPTCDKRVTEKIAYFSSKSFPRNDIEPFQCQLRIKPLKDICWIRLDLETFELNSDGSGGSCTYDSMGLLNSPDGPGGRICGSKSGYAIVSSVPSSTDLILSVLVQGPSYRWNIKITQLACEGLAELSNYSKCGLPNPNGIIDDNGGFQRRVNPKNPQIKVRRRRKKKVLRKLRSKRAPDLTKEMNLVSKKKLRNEKFFHSFSAKNTYCTSKFRNEAKITNIIHRDDASEEILLKIIDGTETQIHEYPWMVSLQIGGSHFCGGSLINEHWVLTAAHCLEFGNVPDFLGRLNVVLSDHDLNVSTEASTVYRGVSKIVVYPWWHNIAGSSGDIALLQLNQPVQFTTTIRPICLPTNAEDTYGSELGTTIGWGITEDGEQSAFLREVELNILENTTCYENYRPLDVEIRKDMICTFLGPKGTENICSGDSGGPLMVQNKKGRFTHVGLTSFSLADCTFPFPAVFTRTTYYLDWMRAVLTGVP